MLHVRYQQYFRHVYILLVKIHIKQLPPPAPLPIAD